MDERVGLLAITAFNLIGEVEILGGLEDLDDLCELELKGFTVATLLPFFTEESELDLFMGELLHSLTLS